MEILRTPEERFASLPGWPYRPNYIEVEGIRIHYVDEGPRQAAPVLLMHGEPSWSYLYRRMIPILAAAGHRVLAPDLGQGRFQDFCSGSFFASIIQTDYNPDRETHHATAIFTAQ